MTSPATPALPEPLRFAPREAFSPAQGLESAHAQTLYAHFFRRTRTPPVRRERWETPDGDFIDVDRLAAPAAAPHVVVVHGLEGSSQTGYVAGVVRRTAARGWGALALNLRSCSGEPNRLLRSYHAGETGDVLWAVERLRREVEGPLVGVGYSLGANLLLRLLGETGEHAPLDAVAAVSPPYDLAACARALDEGDLFTTVYRLRFLLQLRQKALAKARRFRGRLDVAAARRARTLVAFDDAVTAPLHGFRDAADYYARASCGPVLGAIRRPTLLVTALDDPMIPGRCYPAAAVRANRWLSPAVTERGGHIGFVAGSALRPRYWADELALEFLGRAIEPRVASREAGASGAHQGAPG